jgi:hypothetical protein
MPYEISFGSQSQDQEVEIESSSKPGEFYTVVLGEEYDSCTCIGFRYRQRCKHLLEAREKLSPS